LKIRDYVDVVAQPTVVRLEQLQQPGADWISQSYYLTEETGRYLQALRSLLSKDTGCGVFLIGHYGSGKSHFLAYVTQQLQAGRFGPRRDVVPVSLLNFRSAEPLDRILYQALDVESASSDRRVAWNEIERRHPDGLVLTLDELSEFLRSKSSPQSFNEDLRFLQFLGEWAQSHPLWIVAALQEQIEHTGAIEYDLYRKIRDRYPVRFILSATHIKDLIAERILRKKPHYAAAVEELAQELKDSAAAKTLNLADFQLLYPIHPATLELLDEVRDRFSQARGIVDFALTRLLGNEARGVPAFLEAPWGSLITPDAIVDHFADLFEVQHEFLPIAQKVLPHYRKQAPVLFGKEAQRELAWRLVKLILLAHLSPRRESISVEQAAEWLMLRVSSVDPAKDREIIKRTLDVLAEQGAFIKRHNGGYRLDLQDDSGENLDRLLAQTVEELRNRGDALFEELLPCLQGAAFNPFALPRERWHTRSVRWCFHDRQIPVYFGSGDPPAPPSGPALLIGMPWGPQASGRGLFGVQPARIEATPELLELAGLLQLKSRPLPARVLRRIDERISRRAPWFHSLVRAAYVNSAFLDPAGQALHPMLNAGQEGHVEWLNGCAIWALRQTYPQFEKMAPSFGALPQEAYRQLMRFLAEHDLGEEQAPEYVRLIREAYLLPMGLMQRRGGEYVMTPKLENHELVRLLAPMLEHHPSPARIYERLAAPVYGLVADQIQLLLMLLLVQGEIDIVKGEHSYRDHYETLMNPLQYDRILPGRGLSLQQLKDLQALCEAFHVPIPRQWTVLAQKRAVEQLRKVGAKQRDALGAFVMKLRAHGEAAELVQAIERLIGQWVALEKGDHELQGLQHFLFEIGAPQRFVAEAADMALLPGRYERLMRETERYRHLFGYLKECTNADFASAVAGFDAPPSLVQHEALQEWLDRARVLYDKYQSWYRAAHEDWRGGLSRHPIWKYQLPAVARSKHLGLSALERSLERLRAKAAAERCAGLTNLEFQPFCRCGFDGSRGALDSTLEEFDEAASRLETELRLFFQQDRVKSRVRAWVEQKLELNDGTLAYLEANAGYPEVQNLALFDQHLSGLELAQTVESETLLELLEERVWEKSALKDALERYVERLGAWSAFHRERKAPRTELASWCCEQALRFAAPLPAAFSPEEQSAMTASIQPQWISRDSLRRLEDLGLPEEAIRRVLSLLLDGAVPIPESPPASGAVAAALELIHPRQPETAQAMAQGACLLYAQHDRLIALRRKPWLSRLSEFAEAGPTSMPEGIQSLLQGRLDAQWLVVDCLGIPFVGMVRRLLPEVLPRWSLAEVNFGLVSETTSTQAFYTELLQARLNKSFEKINVLDDLLHERKLSFSEFLKLAQAELEIALKRAASRFDCAKPLLIFADHGFRLNADGSGFSHGGASMLERIVPVFDLQPR
jgi:hypothetical protein